MTRDFVGRTDELATFAECVDRADNGVPVVLLVSGEAGIGKSTLLAEAASRTGVPLHLGRCVHMGGDVIPLAPLADLLRQVHRETPHLLADVPALDALRRWLAPGTATGAATGSTTDSAGRTGNPAVSGDLFGPVLDLVAHLAADRTVAIGFEDLHWADAVTLDLFEFLARNLVDEGVVLIGTYRTNEVGTAAQRQRLAALPRLAGSRRIVMAGLDRADIDARVTRLLGGAAPADLVEEILARGHGNPFFTEELVAAHVAGDPIPVVLSDLISAEIADLDEVTRHVLGVVAAVGRETPHALLVEVSGSEPHDVERAVRTAIDAHLLVVDRTTESYRFRHALIGEVIYADLLPPQRVRLHQRIAEALALQPAEVLGRADRAGELAFHLDRAGDQRAAFRALLAAADASERVAPASALRHLERAVELWDLVGDAAAGERRVDRLWQAAELASAAVGNERAAELARVAIELGPPTRGAAWGHERLGRYLWSSGRLAESRTHFGRAVELLPADAGREAAAVYAGLGQAELMGGRYREADEWCDKVFDTLDTVEDDRAAWVMARRVRGVVRSTLGDPDLGVVLCREAHDAAPTSQTRALATLYLCVALLDAGRNQEAVNVALDAVAQGRLAGLDQGFGGYTDALAAEGLTRLGQWHDAQALLTRHATYDTLPVGALRVVRAGAMLAARQGDGDRARQLLDDAAQWSLDGWHATLLELTIADVHRVLGDWATTSDAVERAMAGVPAAATLWTARFVAIGIEAAVESTLDAVAEQQPVSLADIHSVLDARLAAVAGAVGTAAGHHVCLDTAAHLAHADAMLTRLASPDPDAWARSARCWSDLGDRWAAAVATFREAEAAASTGAMDRAATALRDAYAWSTSVGAGQLIDGIEALARRTRLSLEAPTGPALDGTSVQRLGLTTREAEVLTLVAGGLTNRQIGAELFVSEKTASVHVSNILRKLGVATRVDAAAVAQRLGVD